MDSAVAFVADEGSQSCGTSGSGNNAALPVVRTEYRPEIDGLRAVAVIPVLLTHAGFTAVSGGFLGVDVFFVISGYLITTILLREFSKTGHVSIMSFYERRARRILPTLFVVTAVTFVLAWMIMLPKEFRDFGQSVVASGVFLSNVFFASESDYFASVSAFKPFLHTWSLSVEEQFYLVFPVLLLTMAKFSPGNLKWVLAALALTSFSVGLHGSKTAPTEAFFLPAGRAWELLAGALLVFIRPAAPADHVRRLMADLFSLAGLVAILLAYMLLEETTPNPGAATLLPVVGTCAIILFAMPGTMVYRFLTMKALIGIGLISYSAYLWHQPLFVMSRFYFIEISVVGWCVLIGITLLLAWASWAFVEAPFRSSDRIGQRTILIGGGAGLAAMVAAGLTVHLADGFPGRLDEQRRLVAIGQQSISPYRDSCGNTLPQDFESFCVFGDNDKSLVAFVGDSHGKEIFWRTTKQMEGRDYAVQGFLWNGCLPFAAYDEPRACDMFLEAAKAHILASENISTVVFFVNWQAHLGCGKFCDENNWFGGGAERARGMEKIIQTEIEAYLEAGKEVVLSGQIPGMRSNIPHKLNAQALRGLPNDPVGIAEAEHGAQAAPSIRMLSTFERKLGVSIFRPSQTLCSDGFCKATDGVMPLYFDHGHLNGFGADKLVRPLLQAIDLSTSI